jgi:hypothetical protein
MIDRLWELGHFSGTNNFIRCKTRLSCQFQTVLQAFEKDEPKGILEEGFECKNAERNLVKCLEAIRQTT